MDTRVSIDISHGLIYVYLVKDLPQDYLENLFMYILLSSANVILSPNPLNLLHALILVSMYLFMYICLNYVLHYYLRPYRSGISVDCCWHCLSCSGL